LDGANAAIPLIDVLQPTRDELITAWHKRCPTLTRLEAALSFDEWWEAGCLDVKWDAKTGKWRVLLSEERTRQ
jgi:hypothetical protein